LTATAIEERADRVGRIRRNALTLGVPGLQIVGASAPESLAGLDTPDAVFVGGGTTTPGVLDAARAALRPRGRLVVNAVSLESEAILLQHYERCGGTLLRVSLARSGPLGDLSGWRPAMPVLQWSWVKS